MNESDSVVLSLESDMKDDRLAQMTRELTRDLGRSGIEAKPIEAPAREGDRGDIITAGHVAIVFCTSGAAAALFEVLRPYFAREPKLKIRIKGADGTTVTVDATNVETGGIQRAVTATLESMKS